jgi:hypothetical protein
MKRQRSMFAVIMGRSEVTMFRTPLYGSSWYSAQAVSPQRLDRIAEEAFGDMEEDFGLFEQVSRAIRRGSPAMAPGTPVMPASPSHAPQHPVAVQIQRSVAPLARQTPQVQGDRLFVSAAPGRWPEVLQQAARICARNECVLRFDASDTELGMNQPVLMALQVLDYRR